MWRVEVGIANTGWLPTYVSDTAKKEHLVLPLTAELVGGEVVGGTARLELGQLEGRSARASPACTDGTPDRVLVDWTVRRRRRRRGPRRRRPHPRRQHLGDDHAVDAGRAMHGNPCIAATASAGGEWLGAAHEAAGEAPVCWPSSNVTTPRLMVAR